MRIVAGQFRFMHQRPEAARRRPLAQPFHIDAAPYLRIELHSIHPSCVPQNTVGMLGGPLDRSGFPSPSGDADRRSVVYFCSAVLSGRGIRGWKKLHLGVDGSGVIVAHALTGGHVDDATTALDLIDKVEGDVSCLTADAAYDTRGIYEAAGARGATVVIPPTRTATVSGRRPRSPARDRTIRQVQQAGRRQWKKDSGYHQQARVENAFFRYKLIIGESLRARSRAGQETEAILACNILNQMTQLGRPASYAIGR